MYKPALIAALGLSLMTPIAFAQAPPQLKLKEKRVVTKGEALLAKQVKKTNEVCGSQIRISFDWASFKAADAVNGTAVTACSSQLGKLERVCKDDEGKEAISSSIDEMRCAYATEENRSHAMVGRTLVESYWVKSGKGHLFYTLNSPLLEKWLGDNL